MNAKEAYEATTKNIINDSSYKELIDSIDKLIIEAIQNKQYGFHYELNSDTLSYLNSIVDFYKNLGYEITYNLLYNDIYICWNYQTK